MELPPTKRSTRRLLELKEHESCMVGYRLENTLSKHGSVSRGICEVEQGQLVRVTEHKQLIRDTHARDILSVDVQQRLAPELRCSMNFWGFHPQFVTHLEDACRAFLQAHGDSLYHLIQLNGIFHPSSSVRLG